MGLSWLCVILAIYYINVFLACIRILYNLSLKSQMESIVLQYMGEKGSRLDRNGC